MADKVQSLENAGIIMIIVGALFSLLSYFEFFLYVHLLLSPKYNTLSDFGPAGKDFVQALAIHLGSIIIALGICVIYLARHYTPDFDRFIISAVGIWFILDSSSSIIFSYGYNVFLNVFFLICFLVLLYLIKRDYKKKIHDNKINNS